MLPFMKFATIMASIVDFGRTGYIIHLERLQQTICDQKRHFTLRFGKGTTSQVKPK